jgi:tripartite-type tricarboxylate transporter receptor subunit TctC
LMTSENEKKAINFLIASEQIGRPIIGPPGMQADRVASLRKAFDSMMKDPEFLDYAHKAKMDMDPMSGEKAAAIAAAIQNTPPEAVEIARKFME